MRDIVRDFEAYCEDNLILFAYGSEAHLNLIEGDLDPNQLYLLLFPVKRNAVKNSFGTKIKGYKFGGRFMLLKGSDYANHYFNENETDEATSKYTTNIEPLLDEHQTLGDSLMCAELELNDWGAEDAVNVLDANKDGIWCTFNIEMTL